MAWKAGGLLKGEGIPTPTGKYTVGCVDLMHQFEGDDHGGLLVRLFYPAALDPAAVSSFWPSRFAPWTSHFRYTRALLESEFSGSWLLSCLAKAFLGIPRIPAVYGVSPLGSSSTLSEGSAEGQPAKSSDQVNWHKSEQRDEEGTVLFDSQSAEVGMSASMDVGSHQDGEHTTESCADSHEPLPVIVFSHGLKSMRSIYSGICCDLASHGYVVAAVEHRDRSACVSLKRVPCPSSSPAQPQFQDEWVEFHQVPDRGGVRDNTYFELRNQQVLQRSREAILALELLAMLNEGLDVCNMMEGTFDFKQFQGRLDLRKAAMMGHSFGGATTIQALSEDQRFLCGIALDCWMIPLHRDLLERGVQQPLLFINSFSFQWPENVRKMMKLTRPPNHNGVSSCRILTIRGTHHMNQSDIPFVAPTFVMNRVGSSSDRPAKMLTSNTAHHLNMEICHAFLKRYLLKDPAFLLQVPNLDGGDHSEHIIFGSNINLSTPFENASEDGTVGQPVSEDGTIRQQTQPTLEDGITGPTLGDDQPALLEDEPTKPDDPSGNQPES